jgi:plastocyanin
MFVTLEVPAGSIGNAPASVKKTPLRNRRSSRIFLPLPTLGNAMKPAIPSIVRAWLPPLALFAACTASANDIIVRVANKEGKPVADAVVYFHSQGSPQAATARPSRPATIEQIDREFVPYVMAVRAGTTVNFPNRDPLMHHVYSFSSVKNFEIKLYSGELPRGIVFDKPGIVTLGCNIHDWMLGYIFIADTPWFAKTAADGTARIADLPAGDYEIRLWHPEQRGGVAAKPVRHDGRTNQELGLTADVSLRKKKFKPPLNPAQYR